MKNCGIDLHSWKRGRIKFLELGSLALTAPQCQPLADFCLTADLPQLAASRLGAVRPGADIQVYSITLSARIVLDRQRHARMPATNVKPRDEFAGLHRFATCRGLISSRHRDVCRSVVTGFRLSLSEVSSIGLLSIHNFTRRQGIPAGISSGATRVTPLVVCFDFPTRVNPQTLCRGWSLPVRLRHTRNTGRAQQRSTNAATGSSVVSLRIHPEPNHRSAFS